MEGVIEPLACAHRNPANSALVAALANAGPVSVEDQWGPGMVIRRGEPCLTTECAVSLADALAPSAPRHAAHPALAPRSMMIVPLNARGRTLGAIALVATDDSGRLFGDEDLKIAMALASRAALLLDNARLYAEARAALRARDDTIAVVSHDLRDPLQSISAATAMLQLDPDDAERAEGIQSITLASTQMRLLVQDLLDISQIDAGGFSITKGRVDLTALIKEAQTLFQPQAEEKAVRLECQFADDLPPVSADRHRVLQVLLNLVGNALKFAFAGGTVVLGAERDGDMIRVSVADTGVGIADDHVTKVFERFWRADRREGGGVGLGLAVAKAIVEAHGGRIGVTSRLGAGSTFHFTLEVHSTAADRDQAATGDRTIAAADGLAPHRWIERDRGVSATRDNREPGAEAAWPQPRSEFRRALDRLPVAAYTCDADGLITYFNRHARDLWGREPRLNDPSERFCGSWRLSLPDGVPIRHDECWMAMALRDGRQYDSQEIVIERPDGTRRRALAHAGPIQDEGGRFVGALNILWDITDRCRAQDAVREADRRKDDFLATLAHELRNPLAPLRAGVVDYPDGKR